MTENLRRFAPPIWAILLTLATTAAFVRLGLWQLDRAEQKRALAARFEAGGARAAVLSSAGQLAELPRYQRVVARGRYDSGRQVLLDNMPSNDPRGPGRPGYRVWTPFQLENGGLVLVDRGWVPAGRTRDELPATAVAEDPHEISGRVDELPRPGLRMGTAQPRRQWPEVLYYPTASELQSLFGAQLPARVILLDADRSEGYERTWQAQHGFGPERHLGYAVQWFALAGAVIAVFLVVNLRTRSKA